MALQKCKECGNEVSSDAKACPKCGAKVKKKFSIIKAIGFFVVAFIVIIIVAVPNRSSSSKGSGSAATLSATDVEMKQGQSGLVVVAGKVANTSGKKLAYAQVEINLFDSQGAQVGSTLANVNNLEPGAAWKFEAPVLQDKATTAKVAKVTAY